MPKRAKGAPLRPVVGVDPRKVKELRRVLKAKTDEEAIRLAIEEILQTHRTVRCMAKVE